jgi:penicillin G amidase
MPTIPRAAGALLAALALALPLPAAADAPPVPPTAEHEALTVLPPGQSGFVSLEGQARGTLTGDPADFGEHLDDQRELYWGFGYKDGAFVEGGEVDRPRPGVRILRDGHGVPAVHGDTGRDVWFGVGYAIAQDRLFLMDAVRRMGRGTFAELTGPGSVPEDIQARILTYSEEEYRGFLAALSDEARDAVEGYAEGVNAWREEVLADPRLLPAEYALLSTLPEPWDAIDILAGGVLITRTVASEGGNEMDNVALLRELEQAHGREEGRGIFLDLVWDDDPAAATTVPAEEGRFPGNAPAPEAQRREVFDAMADWALTLPPELAEGPGTGAAEVPALPEPADPTDAGAAAAATAVRALEEFRAALSGGSLMYAVDGSRTATGAPMLMSGPQLGYSYPSLLVELEVHGGGYHARGFSVPGLPTVGGGYGTRVAWGLTTGYSKTIDSFVETTRTTEDGTLEHLHDGVWKPAECRDEEVRYRAAVEGVPTGPRRSRRPSRCAAPSTGRSSRRPRTGPWPARCPTRCSPASSRPSRASSPGTARRRSRSSPPASSRSAGTRTSSTPTRTATSPTGTPACTRDGRPTATSACRCAARVSRTTSASCPSRTSRSRSTRSRAGWPTGTTSRPWAGSTARASARPRVPAGPASG